MREIKFRAWMPYNEDPNDMRMEYYPQLFAEDGNGIFDINSVFAHPIDYFADNGTYPEAVIKFMQYTGLRDKNGREIYEGDFVRTGEDNIGDPESMIGQVIMREGSWLIENEKMQEAIELFSEITSREVIGNIYENPELLEAEK